MPRHKKDVAEPNISDEALQSILELPPLPYLSRKEVFMGLTKRKLIKISYFTYQHWQVEYNKYKDLDYKQYTIDKNKEKNKNRQLTPNEWAFCELIPRMMFETVSLMRIEHYNTAKKSENARDKAEWLKMYDYEMKRQDAKLKQKEFKTQIDNTVEAFNLLRQAENEIHKKTN